LDPSGSTQPVSYRLTSIPNQAWDDIFCSALEQKLLSTAHLHMLETQRLVEVRRVARNFNREGKQQPSLNINI